MSTPITKTPGIPVTLLSGFLGAGKTTLLKSILEQKEGLEVAVLVNDMAELNIDAALVKKENLLQSQEKIIEMQNGCICCTLREDLLMEMTKLALMKRFDAIVIESTGVSEPQQVAETFTFGIDMAEEEEGDESEPANPVYFEMKKAAETLGYMPESLNELARLDTCVTVIDCKAFSGDLTTCAFLLERYKDMDEEDDRNISHLLIDQIEFADVILLNKCDLVTPEESAAVEQAIKVLNPEAVVHKTINSKVPMSVVMRTGLFDMEKATKSRGWLKSLTEEHVPETEEYGIGSFVYKARTPFHPKRFDDFMKSIFMLNVTDYEEGDEEEEEVTKESKEEENIGSFDSVEARNEACAKRLATMKKNFGHIYRSKGFVWLAGKDVQFGEWSQAGAVASLDYGGVWVGVLPEDFWPAKDTPAYKKDFADGGRLFDRRQEIVIIGHELQKDAIRKALDECLLKKEENPVEAKDDQSWKLGYKAKEDDPLPVWPDEVKELATASEEPDEEDHDHHHHHGHSH